MKSIARREIRAGDRIGRSRARDSHTRVCVDRDSHTRVCVDRRARGFISRLEWFSSRIRAMTTPMSEAS